MKTITTYTVLIILAAAISLSSCKKKQEEATTPKVDLVVSAPQENNVFANGDSVKLTATVNSPVDMHGYEWRIVRKADGQVLASDQKHTHGKSITISSYWVNAVTEKTEAQLSISVETDHEGGSTSRSIHIILNN